MKRLVATTALAATLGWAGGAVAQAPATQSEYAFLSGMLADGTKCNWFSPVERAAIEAGRAEGFAKLQAEGAAVAEAARAKAAAPSTYDCSGAKAAADKASALAHAGYIGALMVVRADAALRMSEPWAQGITTLDAHRPAIRAFLGQLQASDAAGFATFQAREVPVVRNAIALVCTARKSIRTVKGDRACPNLPRATESLRTHATGWLAALEAFIPVLANTPVAKSAAAAAARPPAPPAAPAALALPPGAPSWSQVYVSTEPLTSFEIGSNLGGVVEADCEPGDIVAVLDGAPPEEIIGRKTLKLYRLGSPALLGSVDATGNSVGTLMPIGAPAVPGLHAKGVLRRCRAAR